MGTKPSRKKGGKRNPWKKLLKRVELCGSATANRSRVKEVTITEKDLEKQFSKQNNNCYWLGIPIDIYDVYTTNNPFGPSVDRLDNNKDYHKDNIVICTMLANMGRGRCDSEKFRKVVEKLKDEIQKTH